MADQLKTTSPKPRRWLKWLGITFGVLILLLVVGYFVGTSEWAFKSVILPKVSAAMKARVTVDSASISPFSSVTLRGMKVETKGPDPLVTAQEVRARYSLMDIIKGNINVSEVGMDSPVINLVTFPDGTSNLDPITKQPKKETEKEKKPEPKKAEKPAQLNLQKFAINNATIRKIDQHKDGTRQLLELTGVNLSASNLGNDKSGKLGLAANIKMDQGQNTSSNGVIAAKVNGDFDLALDAALKPRTVKGQTKVDVVEAKGAFQQLAALGIVLNADLTPTQLNDVSVRFAQGGKNLGAITASGPFNAETSEGKLAVAISQIDKQVLNLAGAAMGVDFNQTTINSTNTIESTQRGRMIAVNGQLLVGTMSLTQKGQTTPPLDVRSGYAVTYDQTNKTALVQTFTLNGMQQGNEFLRGTLAKPMLLDMGKGSNAVDESAFDLVVTNFNLPDWKAFAGTNVTLTSGKLAMTLNLVSKQAGKSLTLNYATLLSGLTAASGSNRIENADIGLSARGVVQDFSAVNLEQYRAELAKGGQSAFVAAGALQYNTKSQDADVQVNVDVILPQVVSIVSAPGLTVSSGDVKFTGRVVQKNTAPQRTNDLVFDRTVTGKLNLNNLTGAMGSNVFDRFVTTSDVDIAMRGQAVDIKKLSGAIQQSGQPGGAFDVSGNYDWSKKAGLINAKLVDLNQNALKSFVAAALGEKKLETITINAATTAKLDGEMDGAIKAELHVANLVVNDPSGAVPRSPLAADLNADVAMARQVIDLKQVTLALTKTERAPNSLNIVGRVDLSKSNAYTGNLKITSEGLDVTPYYDLIAKKNTNTAQASKPSSGPAPAPKENKPETEPEPIKLPIAQFTEEMNIAKFFLREIAISNLVSKTTIENGKVAVNPFTLTLNGGAISLTTLFNVSVPGYQYDVNAKMDGVPVEPFVNTFQPERKGQVKGDLFAGVQIKGAGMTGVNLQKNLQGTVGLNLTNGDVKVSEYKWIQKLLAPLAAALQSPELADSPLRWIDARVGIGSGTVTLTNTTVESSLFRAGLSGTVSIAEVLTNSTLNNLPVQLEFRKSLVGKIKYLPTTATSGDFVSLPHFYSIGGTVADPKPHVDKTALAKAAIGEAAKNIGGDAGRVLRGLGLGGAGATNQPGATTNSATGTNAPAGTNAVENVIKGLGGLLNKPASTNTADTNAPTKPKKGFNLNDLLK